MSFETRVYLGVEEGMSRVKRGLAYGAAGGLAVGEFFNALTGPSESLGRVITDVAGMTGGALVGAAVQLILGENAAKQAAVNGRALPSPELNIASIIERV